MSQSRGRIQPGVAIGIALVALCFLLVTSRGCFWSPGHLGDGNWFVSPWRFFTLSGLLQVILGVWVGVDAQKRGSNGYFWGLLVFFTSIIGLLVYLLWSTDVMERISHEVQQSRQSSPPACPACGGDVEDEFKACPACGSSLRCPGCDKTIRRGWNVCPWCTTQLGPSPSE